MPTTPVDAYFREKSAAVEKRQNDELALWSHWNTNGRKPEHLEPLLKKYNPVINQKTKLWKAKTIPESAFKAELQTHLIKALQSYDPNRGAALGTHVIGRLQKAMRYNNRYQNMAYIPEGKTRFIGPLMKAEETLHEELGRNPTYKEISEHLQQSEDGDYRTLTPKKVEEIQRARIRDIPASNFEQDPTEYASPFDEQQLAVAAQILPDIFPGRPDMHQLFRHLFAVDGHAHISSTGALAKKLGKTESQVSRMKTQMGNTLQQYMSPNTRKK